MNGITYLPQLTLTEALEEAWSKIVQVKGRSRRSEFWWTYLILAIIKMICMFIPIIGSIISLAINAATIPLVFRRLHDTGRSGWWFGGYIILSVIFVYNPQNEMFRHFRTKCSISQNETYLRESFSLPINQIKKHRKNLLLRCFFIACLFGYLAKIH